MAGAVWLGAGFEAAEEAGIYLQACWTMAAILGMRAGLGPMSPSPGWPRAARDAWSAVGHPPTREARRARTVGLLVIAAAVLFAVPYFGWLFSIQDRPVSPWPVILIVAVGTLAIVWGPAGLHRARRVLLPMPAPAVAPLVGVLVIAIVFGGVQHGARAAATVKRLGDLREQGDLARLVLDVSTPRVCAAWVGAAPPPAALTRHELLYLGQADSILALYDVTAGRPIRVSSGNVVLVELAAAERATPTLRTCP